MHLNVRGRRLQKMAKYYFREDASRARKDNSSLNLNVLRKTALNLVS